MSVTVPFQVKFVLPRGFRGAFAVIDDQEAPKVPRQGSAYVYQIPPVATLRTSSTRPLRALHAITAVFDDGTPLAVALVGPIAPYADAEIKLRPMYTDSQGGRFFFVGTEADLAATLADRANVRLGRPLE